MGVDTRLLIHARFDHRNVEDFINNNFDLEEKAKTDQTEFPGYCNILFKLRGGEYSRMIHFHYNVSTPIGYCNSISFRYNEEGVSIMEKIAENLGGFLNRTDYDSNYQEYQGKIWDSNGLQFFLKEMVIQGKITEKDLDDVKELKNTINGFYEKHGRN